VDATSGSSLATTNIDWHHNLFMNIDHRLPFMQAGKIIRWINNVVFNWNQFAALIEGGTAFDFIGNDYIDGNLSADTVHVLLANVGNDPNDPTDNVSAGVGDNAGPPSLYLLGNRGRSGNRPNGPVVVPSQVPNDVSQISLTARGWEGGETGDANSQGPIQSSWFRSTPNPAALVAILVDLVQNLQNAIVPTVGNSQMIDLNGNWQPRRDSQDARVIAQYQNRAAGQLFTGQFSAPPIAAGTPYPSSQHDGMSDAWKQKMGLDTSKAQNNVVMPDGYTALEWFLAGRSS
jgi:hypothetical protein